MNDFKYNWQLFTRCIAKLYMDTKRDLIIAFCAAIGFWFVMGLIAGLLVSGGDVGEFAMFFLSAGLFCTLMSSMAFADMKSKEGRINFLMQPARASQKFWARVLLTVPIPIVISFIGFFAIEGGRLIGTAIMTHKWVSMVTPWMAGHLSVEGGIVVILTYLSNQMYFFYGGILWPKMSYQKSLAVATLAYIILIITTGYIVENNASLLINIDMGSYRGILICIYIIGILLFGWLAYRRLIRSTVVYGLRQ